MRFSLFIHMERWDESLTHEEHWKNLVELVQLAEEGGFGTVWIGEHHSMEYTASPSPMPQLAYLAAKTSRIRLGAGTIIAPFWTPIRAAGETALLDVISGGRAEIGIARGAYQFEFDRLGGGMPGEEGGRYLRELVPAVRKLWEGDYAHDGELWQFPVSTSVPKPASHRTPPIWVAARSPETHDFAVAHGCNVQVTPLMKGDEEVRDLKEKFDAAVAAHPEVESRPEIMVLRHTFVHPADEPEGWRPAAEAINRFYRTFSAWAFGKKAPVDGFLEPTPEERFAERPEFAPEAIHRNAMIGTPEEVTARICEYERMGYDEYAFWTDNSLSHEEKKRSLQLFIDEVVPRFV
ncbi:LLM class flavin-dependent oxidoreductase [Rothia sp. AR01]|uniref:LLM class flavin-dependent oxidoreductase n=1 Tax=Rothia santali TaxID=2949643 RepID=A0A9X2HCS6_9MICC|nr:LLM class flavin-dependent oxidoreductase [Rothia santali]MCP3426966.1 LLM class flavin-dependent oxidoreductase [Rothia santali]